MTEHNPMGPWAGRYNVERFMNEPLWTLEDREDDDGNIVQVRVPGYYGQTLALAKHVRGKIADMAGGFVAVVMPELSVDAPKGAAHEYMAYDWDTIGEEGSTLLTWWETEEGEHVEGPNYGYVESPATYFD